MKNGWSFWVCDGAVAGTTSQARRIETIQVQNRLTQ
ncbi:hypothetical protein [Blautia pseudococcoides]